MRPGCTTCPGALVRRRLEGRREARASTRRARVRHAVLTACGNFHPTVKPVAVMVWLCRLVTPPGGAVLDPFAGSGTTGIAALRCGFGFYGVEREAEYAEIARARIVGDAPLFNSGG